MRPIRIVEIANPFQAQASIRELTVVPRPQESVAACLRRVSMEPSRYAIKLDGQIIREGEEEFHVAMPGAVLLVVGAAQGGIGRILAMAALLALTTALTDGFGDFALAVVAGNLGLGALSVGTLSVIAAGISIGGNLLISATLGAGSSATKQASVTYDPSGPKTLAQAGTPIPKGYGTMGWGGNIVASFVDLDGQDEYLNILVGFGWGEAIGMANMLLNGKPIGSYPDLSYQMRLGTNDQTPIPGFDRVQNAYPQQIELLAANGPTIVTGTGLATTGLQVAVKFPGGLMRTDSGGNPKECSLAYKVEISPSGQNQWTTPIFPRTTQDVYTTDSNGFRHYPAWVVMPTDRFAGSGIVYDTDSGGKYPGEPWVHTQSVKVYNIDNTNYSYDVTFQGEWQPTTDITLDLQSVTDWWGGWRIVSNMTNQSFYDVVNVYGLAAGQWDTRVTKWGAGPHNQPIPQGDSYMTDPHYTADAWLWVVTELEFADLAYPNQILLGIRALATSQINGADITVTATITHDIGEDTVLPTQLASFEHDNPAIVAYDIIMNPLYGMAATQPNIQVDLGSWVQWAQFCDEMVPTSTGGQARRFVFAGVFDEGGSNAKQCLDKVATMSRAQITSSGFVYSVWIDAPTDVTQVFTEANIKRGSYSESFLDFDSRATEMQVEFADAQRNWRTDLPISVQTAETLNSGLQPKITRVNLLGCTSRDQAWQWAYFQLLSTQQTLRTASWQCNIEAVSCKQGSVVGVQRPQWSLGGRVQVGSTAASLLIDRDDLPAFSANAGWTVGVQHPIFNRGSAVLQSYVALSPTSALLAFPQLPSGRIMRVSTTYNLTGFYISGSGESFIMGYPQPMGMQLDGALLRWTSGANLGQTYTVVYSLAGGVLVLASPVMIPPASGDTFEIVLTAEGTVTGIAESSLTIDFIPEAGTDGVRFLSGCTVQFYDYDVLDVQLAAGLSNGAIAVQGGFLQAPTPDAPWFYAQTGGDAPMKFFRVTSVKQSGDFTVDIQAMDYIPSNYEDQIPQFGEVVSVPTVNAAVSNLTLTEKLQNTIGTAANGQQSVVTADWTNGPNTAGADIYGQVDGGAWNHMDHVMGKTFSFYGSVGDVWDIRVVGFDRLGVASSYNDAPTASITISATQLCPADVVNFFGSFQATASGGQTNFTWGPSLTNPVTGIRPKPPGGIGGPHAIQERDATAPAAAYYEIRFQPDPTYTDWESADILVSNLHQNFWTDTVARNGTYLIKAISSQNVESLDAATWSSVGISSSLNMQGSIVPTQSVLVNYSTTMQANGTWSVLFDAPAQQFLLADGTSVQTTDSSITLPGLASSTTYYCYLYMGVLDLQLHCASGDTSTPPSAPSASYALAAQADNCYPVPLAVITTPASGTGGSGGGTGPVGDPCPESREHVVILGRGEVEAGTVQPGEWMMGWCFERSSYAYRMVREVRHVRSREWCIVDGFCVSPLHPVRRVLSRWWESPRLSSAWETPREIGSPDERDGVRVKIVLEESAFDEQNYWLVRRGAALLMHNARVTPC